MWKAREDMAKRPIATRLMLLTAAAALLLAACASAQHQADEAAQKAQRAAEQDKADDAECRGYKVPPAGSIEAYNQCRDMLKTSRSDGK
jgi:outer membrane biogenesis lipoprotein LolB